MGGGAAKLDPIIKLHARIQLDSSLSCKETVDLTQAQQPKSPNTKRQVWQPLQFDTDLFGQAKLGIAGRMNSEKSNCFEGVLR